MAWDPVVQRTMVEWLERHGYRVVSDGATAAVIHGEAVDQPAIGPGVTPEVIIRLQRPPEMAMVIVGRAMMPVAVSREAGVLHALTCQALATAWGYRPSGQLDIPSESMCAVGTAAPSSASPGYEEGRQRMAERVSRSTKPFGPLARNSW